MSIILAISDRVGLVHFFLKESAIDRDNFVAFLTELSQLLGDHPANLIFNNARCHFNVPDPSDVHLPPYSLQLNPCELAFSTLKADIKRQFGNCQEEFRNVPENLNLAQHRRNILRQIAEDSLPQSVTLQRCQNWFMHCRAFLPVCIAGGDLPENL